jgi:two-component system CheB/CheR fusion protein
MVLDTALQIIQATDAAATLFGLSRPVGTPHVSQCVLPPDYPSLAPICSETLRMGEAVQQEFSSEGTRLKLTCSPFFDARGQMKGVTMVLSEFPGLAHELDLILDSANIFMINRASDGTVQRISETYAQALGTTRTKAEGQNFYDLVSAEVRDHARAQDHELVGNPSRRLRSIHPITDKASGDAIWINDERVVFPDPYFPGETIYSIGVDVSDLIKANIANEDAAIQLSLLQDIAGAGYWCLDVVNETLDWSRDVFRIHGLDPETDTIDLNKALDFYHPDDRADVLSSVQNVLEQGGDYRFCKRLIRQDGTQIVVESIGYAKANKDGAVERIVGVLRQLQD